MIDVDGGLVSGNGHGLLLGGGERVVGVGGGSAVSSVVAGVRNASGQGRPIPHARANSKTDFLDLADSVSRSRIFFFPSSPPPRVRGREGRGGGFEGRYFRWRFLCGARQEEWRMLTYLCHVSLPITSLDHSPWHLAL